MTRINPIAPDLLTDQHLLAEYTELPRAFALARLNAKRPLRYTMGPGHVTFFYPLTLWLHRRQTALIAECLSRGFDIQHRTAPAPIPGLDGDWEPDAEAIAVNLARLRDRLHARPGWYKHRGVVVGPDFYDWEPL